MSDLHDAIRQLRSAPAFVLAVVITLSLAVGAVTGLFSLTHAIVLRTLPVRDAERIVVLQGVDERGANRPLYYSTFAALRELPVFDALSLYSGGGLFQLEIRNQRVEEGIEAATPGLFESLGLTPPLGRFFTMNDSPTDGVSAPVAVISHDLWQRAFRGDVTAVGETISISGTPATVIGVTPPDFRGFYVDGGFGFSVPLSFLNRQLGTDSKRPVRGLNAIGRLAPGVSLEEARAAVEAGWPTMRVENAPAGISDTERADIARQRLTVDSLANGFSSLRRQYREPLFIVLSLAGALWLLATINLSGLLLVCAMSRQREIAVRLALGSSRGRVARQVVVEHAALCGAGTAGGLLVAWWFTRGAGHVLWQGAQPLALQLTPTWHSILVALFAGLATTIVVSVLPALTIFRTSSVSVMQRARGATSRGSATTKLLLSGQIALSLVLLVGAALLGRTLLNLRAAPTGVDHEGLRWSRLFAVPNGYRELQDATYYPELVRQLSEVPGIRSVALAQHFPTYLPFENLVGVEHVARVGGDSGETAGALMERVTPKFFETTGIQLLRGRDFTWRDDRSAPPVAIINESLRRRVFPARDPLGERIRIGNDPSRASIEVVGVIDDAVLGSFKERNAPVVFRPRMQDALSPRAPVLLFRSNEASATADQAVAKVIGGMGREYPRRFYSLDEQIDIALLRERLLAALSSFAAALATVLAAVGVYSAFALAVARRTREVGVRLAVGASRVSVLQLILRESLWISLLGAAVGSIGAWLGGGVLAAWVFGVAPRDLPTIVGATVFMIAVGLIASLRPASRAAAVDPAALLRQE
jgi:putative ABC transport system permease protein